MPNLAEIRFASLAGLQGLGWNSGVFHAILKRLLLHLMVVKNTAKSEKDIQTNHSYKTIMLAREDGFFTFSHDHHL